ncbi:MAG TPA: DUF4159 domain-containing protein [Rhizomicrobium sp.]|jgi:hypothetical protein|nr:DUF4159 domain-containing protein [Rhizomicrobium sp.]
MSALANLSFGAPWILLGLIALPAIWFLLRVTPPSPRTVMFPPLRLLLGLSNEEETPAHMPLWLLILRIATAALIILALSEPIIGESAKTVSSSPLVLFIDNGWTSAHAWKQREDLIAEELRIAARDDRGVALVATADTHANVTLLDAGEASRLAHEIAPEPWLPTRAKAVAALAKAHFTSTPEILWLSDSLDHGDAEATRAQLSKLGNLHILADAPGAEALALATPDNDVNGFILHIHRASGAGARDGQIEALGAHGEILATAPYTIPIGSTQGTAKIALPLEIRNRTAKLVVANENSAGATQLLDEGNKRRSVGLVSASNAENEQPLLSDLFYLQRALSPYADLHKGTISETLAQNVSVLALADIGKIAGADHDRVAKFVGDGGVLVRFAGARMAQAADDLVPVRLREGGRYLGGAMAWASPQHLAPFPDGTPFDGLTAPAEVTVSRQILAEPSVELADRTWARLADGTPLVTAEHRGRGWIVLFHVTASPAWSSLPLSGLYVDMLRRVLALANGTPVQTNTNAALAPLDTLDGFGRLRKPPADALPLRRVDFTKIVPSSAHPPGYYGAEGSEVALNTLRNNADLTPLSLSHVERYAASSAFALATPLLVLAMLLLLADAIISLDLRGHLAAPRRLFARLAPVLIILLYTHHARADDSFDMKSALDTRLAYVMTGVSDVDAMSHAGLVGLDVILTQRTTYEPQDPVGVDLDRDDLSFFPLLYWPMDPREKDLSPKAIAKLADYMRNGGTIVFDTRDLTLGAGAGPQSPGEQTLRRLTAKLDMPPLQIIPADHVLTKTFYLLQDFPGRWDGSKLWVEALPPPDPEAGPSPARGGDGVSPVVIGGNDWAAAWAVDNQGRPLVAVVPGGERQREMAYRFGVNLVMYAFTGNYKTDQVHVPALLQRLGK